MLNQLSTTALLIVAMGFPASAATQNNIKNEAWFAWAQKYADADETLAKNAVEDKPTFIEDAKARDGAQLALLKVQPPPIDTLAKLLQSGDPQAKKAALINIFLRGIDDRPLLKSVLDTYRHDDEFFLKFYSVLCFVDLNDVQLKDFEDQLIKVLFTEKMEGVTIPAMPVLMRLDTSKTRPLFVEYLKSGTDGTRAASIIYLRKTYPALFNEIWRELDREGVDIWAGSPKWRFRLRAAEAQIAVFSTALETYKQDVGTYPTTTQGLQALRVKAEGATGWQGPYVWKDIPNDPWNHPYVYKFPGKTPGKPEIVFYGADGQPGGEGENADIFSE